MRPRPVGFRGGDSRPFMNNAKDELLNIVQEAHSRIVNALNRGEEKNEIFPTDGCGYAEGDDACIEVSATVEFGEDSPKSCIFSLTMNLNLENPYWLISRCDLECAVEIPVESQEKWLAIFQNHPSFFSRKDGGDPGITVIGLCRQPDFPVSFKQELERFVDGHSSKTPDEMKQIFQDFLAEFSKEDSSPPQGFLNLLKPELKLLLDDFLTCVEKAGVGKNH